MPATLYYGVCKGCTDATKTALYSAGAEGHAVIVGDRNASVSINVSTSEIADLNVSGSGRVYAAALHNAEIKVHAADTYPNPTDTHDHPLTYCTGNQRDSAKTALDKVGSEDARLVEQPNHHMLLFGCHRRHNRHR